MYSRLARDLIAFLGLNTFGYQAVVAGSRSGSHTHHICAPIELRAFVGVIAPRRPHAPFRRRAFRRATDRQLKPRRSRPGCLALR